MNEFVGRLVILCFIYFVNHVYRVSYDMSLGYHPCDDCCAPFFSIQCFSFQFEITFATSH
jgi:hypothetical protein